MGDNDPTNNVSVSKTFRLEEGTINTCELRNMPKRLKYDDTDSEDDKHQSFAMVQDVTTNLRDYNDTSLRRKNPIMFMPTEVLQRIFRFLNFQDLGLI